MSKQSEYKHLIRGFLQDPRCLNSLVQDQVLWTQITGAFDAIESTESAIEAYMDTPDPVDSGGKILLTYGILHVLLAQQDALEHLARAFHLPLQFDAALRAIRQVRYSALDDADGVRVQGDNGSGLGPRYIVESFGPTGTLCLTRPGENDEECPNELDPLDLVETQKRVLDQVLEIVWNVFREQEQQYRDQFRDEKFSSAFPSTLGYLFEKAAALNWNENGNGSSSQLALNGIRKTVYDFRAALAKRGVLTAQSYLQSYFAELQHPLNELDCYVHGQSTQLDEQSASIYLYFVQNKVQELQQIASELDKETFTEYVNVAGAAG